MLLWWGAMTQEIMGIIQLSNARLAMVLGQAVVVGPSPVAALVRRPVVVVMVAVQATPAAQPPPAAAAALAVAVTPQAPPPPPPPLAAAVIATVAALNRAVMSPAALLTVVKTTLTSISSMWLQSRLRHRSTTSQRPVNTAQVECGPQLGVLTGPMLDQLAHNHRYKHQVLEIKVMLVK
jgi:hypothetical protein